MSKPGNISASAQAHAIGKEFAEALDTDKFDPELSEELSRIIGGKPPTKEELERVFGIDLGDVS